MTDDRASLKGVYGAGHFALAAPGDEQREVWILRFSDPDIRERLFMGEDAERDAWLAWNQYAPAYNCYLFRLAALARTPEPSARGALKSTLSLIDEIFRKYGIELDAEDVAVARSAREILATPPPPAVLAEREQKLVEALREIGDASLPDQPATAAGSDYDWACQHIARLRRRARTAISEES